MAPRILAVIEARDGAVRKISLELLAAARELAGPSGAVDALVFGAALPSGADALPAFGADRVLSAAHPDFARYNPDGFAATATGKDLAPRVAARLGLGLASDVTGLALVDGAVIATRPVYAGRAIQKVRLRASP